MLFLSVRGFSDYAGPTVHSRLAWLPCCLPLTRNEVGILIYGLFAAQSPRPPMPLSTLQETPRDLPSKTRGQDGFATSFPVGLLHPLQHAGLSRRSRAARHSDSIANVTGRTTSSSLSTKAATSPASSSSSTAAGPKSDQLDRWRFDAISATPEVTNLVNLKPSCASPSKRDS